MNTNYRMRVTKYSNYFKIDDFRPDAVSLILQFTRRFVRVDDQTPTRIPKWRRFTGEPLPPPEKPKMTVFAAATNNGMPNNGKSEYRFHINSFNDFMMSMDAQGIPLSEIHVVEVKPPEALKVKLPLKKGWAPRDYQEPVVEFASRTDPRVKLVALNTGDGKTSVSLFTLAKLGERFLVSVKAGFLEKWVQDIVNVLDIKPKHIMLIQGGKSLKAFLQLCKDDALGDIRAIVLSNRTYQMWVKAYEEMGEGVLTEYPAKPEDLFELAKVGTRLIDEVHLDFHLWFKMDMYTNVKNCVSMSATLKDLDPVTERMYALAYPYEHRYISKSFKAHVKSYMVGYNTSDRWHLKTQEGTRPGYSHNAYEKSIMKEKELINGYNKMIEDIIRLGYTKNFQPRSKALVFCSTIEMCTNVTEHLKKAFPEHTVERYVGGDPDSNLKDPDIRVSTPGSAGTGHDIPGLATTVQTVGVKSYKLNLQSFGRLREPKGDFAHIQTKFYYLYNNTEERHRKLRVHKMKLLKEKSKTLEDIYYPVMF